MLVAAVAACAPSKISVRAVGDLMANGVPAFEKDADLDLVQHALPAHIKLLEALLETDPRNRQMLVLLARLYTSYAFAFIDGPIEAAELSGALPQSAGWSIEAEKQRAIRYYRRSNEYALRALEVRHPEARRILADPAAAGPFIDRLTRRDTAALFWYGFSLSADINHNRDSIAAVGQGHLVEKAMRRVIETDETYFFGGAHLVLLVYYGSRPPLAGGRPALADGHYRRLRQITGGGFHLADLFFARYVLYQRQDRSEFVAVMQRILGGSAADERYRLYNSIAAERAHLYLGAADRLFIE